VWVFTFAQMLTGGAGAGVFLPLGVPDAFDGIYVG
jgi:hypothetical protein